ncbi:glycosyltransferase family 32 protein [Pedobacter sp. MW01-1-1]|uniref:glycosyltransferase family 32 protein n=1 Tax=Pedobacter sp. MW01-1-1 TaxID=3383027 RepID=UPI003FEF492F
MAIPKIIHQTYKTKQLPWITRWQIKRFCKKNPEYKYEFYDDARVDEFIRNEFNNETYQLYKKINIGAAKADFFRYAVLYKQGGVYLDIDSAIKGKLSNFIHPEDVAVISKERNPDMYVQWGLVYEPGHPFLEKTLELICENIESNKFPHDVHKMTGPFVYSEAIENCIKNNPNIPHRLLGVDYNGNMKFRYPLAKVLLNKNGSHWRNVQQTNPVLLAL